MSMGGIKNVSFAIFSDEIYSKMSVVDNEVVGIDAPLVFIPMSFTKEGTKYSEVYNFTSKNYEQTFNLEIGQYSFEKRLGIETLVKAKFVIIFQDKNGKYYILGEKNGISCSTYQATTDSNNGKSSYLFTFTAKSSYLPIGVSSSYISNIKTVDCSILDNQLALTSPVYISPYSSCLIGNLPNFIP